MMKKQRTMEIQSDVVDFMVTEYSCVDSAVLPSLGSHHKETKWKVQAGSDVTTTTDIKVNVDQSLGGKARVAIHCDKNKVFPLDKDKAHLKTDFVSKKPFRGVFRDLNKRNIYEVRPPFGTGYNSDQFYPCVLSKQREDGQFEAVVQIPDSQAGGFRQEVFPAIHSRDIREKVSQKPIMTPERILNLEVPANDPLHATLCLDNKDLMTHYFGRPTPAPGKTSEEPRVVFNVNEDRTQVSGNVGHNFFTQFLQQKATIVKQTSSKLKHSWTIRIGPYSEHTIEIEKRWKSSKIATLTVDGSTLVESAPEDLDIQSDTWECTFYLKGEKSIDFNVFETNADGQPTGKNVPATVTMRRRHACECKVVIKDPSNMHHAEFRVDGVLFRDLEETPTSHTEGNITNLTPEVFRMSYEMPVPFKVSYDAPRGLGVSLGALLSAADPKSSAGGQGSGFFGLFASCMGLPQLSVNEVDVKEVQRYIS
jgi:hypothetical protein